MALAKPQLRGLYARKIKIHLPGAIITSLVSGFLWKTFYMDPRKKAHDDFYKTYDDDKQLEIMINAGLLQSVPKPE